MDSFILKLQSKLTQELEKTFGNFVQADIGILSDAIERFIPNKIETILSEFTNQIINNSSVEYGQLKTIKTEKFKLQIRISDSIEDTNELMIGYMPLFKKDGYKKNIKTVNVSGFGKYEKISVLLPSNLQINVAVLLHFCKSVIEICYNWFFQKLKEVVKESTIISSHIYSYLKSLFPNQPNVYKTIWLICAKDEKIIYLLDEENVSFALNKIKKYELFKDESPFKQINELINIDTPYKDTFAKLCAATQSTMSVNPLDGKYAEQSTLLAIGEAGLWEEDATAMPLLTEGKVFLFAAFPTKYINLIEPVLQENKLSITHEFLSFQNRVDKLLRIMTKQKIDLGEIGKFAGNFLGGFLNAIN